MTVGVHLGSLQLLLCTPPWHPNSAYWKVLTHTFAARLQAPLLLLTLDSDISVCPMQAALLASAQLQPHQMPVQALIRKASVPPVSPSGDTGDGGNPFGMPKDKVERRYD